MQMDFILTREIEQLPEPAALAVAFDVRHLHDPNDRYCDVLDRFYTAQGFPAKWSERLLASGAQGVMICCGASAIAAGWLTRKPFYVEEIRRTFDPGSAMDYYFGDFVAPEFRGKGLQRALIRERLRLTHQSGRKGSTAMTNPALPASYNNYCTEGFSVTLTLCKRVCLGMEWTRVCCTDSRLFQGRLSKEGLRMPFSSYLRLRR